MGCLLKKSFVTKCKTYSWALVAYFATMEKFTCYLGAGTLETGTGEVT
jgi:hypothetical protein